MLVYHPYSDINHGIFRLFMLHEYVFGSSIDFDYWRILDFIYVFPNKANDLSVPRQLLKKKRVVSKIYNKYNDVKSPREMLSQNYNMHLCLTNILSAKNVIDKDKLFLGKIVWNIQSENVELHRVMEKRAIEEEYKLSFLKDLLMYVPEKGPNGIKARSKWMEYRYDV